MNGMTRDHLLTYIGTLDKQLQEVFATVNSMVMQAPDTLTEDYQMAATVWDAFERRAFDDWKNRQT